METTYLHGTVVRAFNGKTKFDSAEKNRITVKVINIDDFREEVNDYGVYKESGKKMTPKWVTDSDYVNLSSKFDIPCQGDCDNFLSILNGAKVSIKVVLKDGCIYPMAIKIHENGTEINPFEEFEEVDESMFNEKELPL